MTEPTPSPPAADAPQDRNAATIAASPVVRSAARWFWWIAGLSLVNTIMTLSKADSHMVVGLGMTLVSDVLFGASSPVGFAIDAVALGFFVLMGHLAQRGQLWAFCLGIAVYAVDALVYLKFEDWIPVAFHALVIYFIFRGMQALRQGLAAAN
jgi:hypothetical protein